MRKFLAIALVVLTAVFGMGTASAQVRIQGIQNPVATQRLKPRLKQVRPRVLIIPPSAAVRSALRAVPNAKPLGVKPRGQLYIVKLKQGGRIVQVGVDRRTGAVMPLP